LTKDNYLKKMSEKGTSESIAASGKTKSQLANSQMGHYSKKPGSRREVNVEDRIRPNGVSSGVHAKLNYITACRFPFTSNPWRLRIIGRIEPGSFNAYESTSCLIPLVEDMMAEAHIEPYPLASLVRAGEVGFSTSEELPYGKNKSKTGSSVSLSKEKVARNAQKFKDFSRQGSC
jgi:hypothetical protein